jgi:hypothetical protein
VTQRHAPMTQGRNPSPRKPPTRPPSAYSNSQRMHCSRDPIQSNSRQAANPACHPTQPPSRTAHSTSVSQVYSAASRRVIKGQVSVQEGVVVRVLSPFPYFPCTRVAERLPRPAARRTRILAPPQIFANGENQAAKLCGPPKIPPCGGYPRLAALTSAWERPAPLVGAKGKRKRRDDHDGTNPNLGRATRPGAARRGLRRVGRPSFRPIHFSSARERVFRDRRRRDPAGQPASHGPQSRLISPSHHAPRHTNTDPTARPHSTAPKRSNL